MYIWKQKKCMTASNDLYGKKEQQKLNSKILWVRKHDTIDKSQSKVDTKNNAVL